MPSLKAFIRDSKALFKLCAEREALDALRPAKGKAFHLRAYGLEIHLPAVVAEICLEAGVATKLHQMLVSLRSVKQGPHKGKLRA